MKFFFRAETKTAARSNGESKRLRWQGALSVALAAFCVVGCVGRKQYAINEAILISERRQLEDEIYRLQFELRDALEENERLRQELGGDATDANVPASRTRARTGANDAFFPGLDATQTSLRTTGGAKNASAPSSNVLRTDVAPQNADSAPATGEAIETLPDYVPIPVTSTQSDGAQTQRAPLAQIAQDVQAAQIAPSVPSAQIAQTAQSGRVAPTAQRVRNAQNASSARTGKTRSAQHFASVANAPQDVGKMPGVRRVVPVAASDENGGDVVASVFVDAPSTEKTEPTKSAASRSASVDGWSPLAR